MAVINLRDVYPFYDEDQFVEVEEDVFEVFQLFKRKEKADERRIYRNKAFYSLDRQDGIELEALTKEPPSSEAGNARLMNERVQILMCGLTKKQFSRIYAHFFLGMSYADIARKEKKDRSSIYESVKRGVERLKRKL